MKRASEPSLAALVALSVAFADAVLLSCKRCFRRRSRGYLLFALFRLRAR